MPERTADASVAELNEIREVCREVADPTKNPAPKPLHPEQVALELRNRGYRKQPVSLPDRDELAFELFAADNSKQSREQSRIDFDQLKTNQAAYGGTIYVYPLADAAIEAFRKANQ